MAKKATADSDSPSPTAASSEASRTAPATPHSTGNGKYTVVARRYRPKTFSELVGQSTVAQALLSAIHSNRVGHAYLFTGARGVGKTSTARIFAKALNAAAETDGLFDPNSDVAQAIDAGEDMDVLEIDGASNRGIDEIRQLRANAAVRPSRSRYKIYIIDEVHMLTTQAFNALLKTLEEPPGHVKFIFCTTDPEKIPITVLSRCQRFDFPPVHTEQIYERLKFICENEGTKADEAALRLIARRAAGSMRDSQSLLEQLLSFGGGQISVEIVHAMLGTADETRLASFASRLIERDAAGALRELDNAASEGVDVGQLAEQLLGYLRDMMAVSVGGGPDLIRTANTNSAEQLKQWGKSWGTMTLLSALQLLDETIVRMRHSVQSRILLEVALVQICNLQDLQSLSDIVKAFATGQQAPPSKPASPLTAPNSSGSQANPVEAKATEAKKKVDLEPEQPQPLPPEVQESHTPLETHTLQEASIEPVASDVASPTDDPTSQQPNSEPDSAPQSQLELFREVATNLGGFAEQCAELSVEVESISDSQWKICLSRDGTIIKDYFQTGDNSKRLTQSLRQRLGRGVHLTFEVTEQPSRISASSSSPEATVSIAPPSPSEPTLERAVPQAQLIRNAMNNPLVKKFMDVFEGQVIRVDAVRVQIPAPNLDLAREPGPTDPTHPELNQTANV
jgi:DNA polymerase-3 subunit gamma/tau